MSANVHEVSLTLRGALAVPASEIAPWEPSPLDLARYWTKVDKRGPTGCWVWIGGTHGRGTTLIGSIRWGARNKPTNPVRIAWQLDRDTTLREGVPVFRLCDTILCVNPDHLTREPVLGHAWRKAELAREKPGPHAKCTACKTSLAIAKFYKRKTGGILQPCRSCWQKQFTKSSESSPDPEIVRAAAIAHRGECVCHCLFTAHVEKKHARGDGDRGHCVNCGSEKCPGYFERNL